MRIQPRILLILVLVLSTAALDVKKVGDPIFDASANGYSYFGSCLATDGSVLAIGAPHDLVISDPNLDGSVSIYVPKGNSWSFLSKLHGSMDTQVNMGGFGTSVAISDEWLVVGVPNCAYTAPVGGCVTIYTRKDDTTFTLKQVLAATDDGPNKITRSFGYSVSIEGDTLVVGASTASVGDYTYLNLEQGEVYVYTYSRQLDSWGDQQILVATDGQQYDHFGTAIALSGNTLFIGAPGNQQSTGAVYVWTRTGSQWSQSACQKMSGEATRNAFGTSLSTDGTRLVVGAPTTNYDGAAYVYNHTGTGTGWVMERKLTGSHVSRGAGFGQSVLINDTNVFVGASSTTGLVTITATTGSVYRYVRGGNGRWDERTEIVATEASHGANAGLGYSLAIDERKGLVFCGADAWQDNQGSVYVADLNPKPHKPNGALSTMVSTGLLLIALALLL